MRHYKNVCDLLSYSSFFPASSTPFVFVFFTLCINGYKFLVRKSIVKKSLGRSKRKLKNNIKINLKEITITIVDNLQIVK